METKSSKSILLIQAFCLVLILVIFLIDTFIPLGVAGGVPYIIPILISLWVKNLKFTLILSIICSIMTVVGFFSSPEGGVMWKVLFNRGLALLAIWSCSSLSIMYIKQLEREMAHYNELEKIKIYKKTTDAVRYLVKSLHNNFVLINESEKIKEELGPEIIKLLTQSSQEVEEILDKLCFLEDISVEAISEIIYSNAV